MTVPAKATPAPPAPAKIHKNKQTNLIKVLKTDHNFDIVEEIVKHLKMLHGLKRVPPPIKHKMIQTYHIALLGFCVPKMKIVEDNTDKNSRPMNFQINVGGNDPASGRVHGPTKGVNINIPTKKNKDGSFSVTK